VFVIWQLTWRGDHSGNNNAISRTLSHSPGKIWFHVRLRVEQIAHGSWVRAPARCLPPYSAPGRGMLWNEDPGRNSGSAGGAKFACIRTFGPPAEGKELSGPHLGRPAGCLRLAGKDAAGVGASFPSTNYMRHRYGHSNQLLLPFLYLHLALKGVAKLTR
jgi:hypothetical protein